MQGTLGLARTGGGARAAGLPLSGANRAVGQLRRVGCRAGRPRRHRYDVPPIASPLCRAPGAACARAGLAQPAVRNGLRRANRLLNLYLSGCNFPEKAHFPALLALRLPARPPQARAAAARTRRPAAGSTARPRRAGRAAAARPPSGSATAAAAGAPAARGAARAPPRRPRRARPRLPHAGPCGSHSARSAHRPELRPLHATAQPVACNVAATGAELTHVLRAGLRPSAQSQPTAWGHEARRVRGTRPRRQRRAAARCGRNRRGWLGRAQSRSRPAAPRPTCGRSCSAARRPVRPRRARVSRACISIALTASLLASS